MRPSATDECVAASSCYDRRPSDRWIVASSTLLCAAATSSALASRRLTWYVSAVYSSPVSLLYNMVMDITGPEEAV